MPRTTSPPWLHRLAVVTAAATLLLLGIGGLVTSHGVGLAVPDWPNSYGYNMFFFPVSQWVGGILYEHTHRLWASLVGLLTLVLALGLYGVRSRPWLRWGGAVVTLVGAALLASSRGKWDNGAFLCVTGAVAVAVSFFWPTSQPAERWLRQLSLAALVLVVLQGVLGGVRVVAVRNEIGILHGTAAQLFFALICVIALVTSPWWRGLGGERAAGVPRGWRLLFLSASALILLQLVLGATMRHQHAGLAIPDFPLAYGALWPATDAASLELVNQSRLDVRDFGPVTAFQVHLHMLHRLLAVAILLAVGFCAARCWRQHGLRSLCSKLSTLWLGLILAQAVLGALTVLQNKPADIATLHVMVGAACLAVGSLVTILVFRWSLAPATAGLLPARERVETAPVSGARGAMSAA